MLPSDFSEEMSQNHDKDANPRVRHHYSTDDLSAHPDAVQPLLGPESINNLQLRDEQAAVGRQSSHSSAPTLDNPQSAQDDQLSFAGH